MQTGKNWTGTITLGTDVVVGDHTHAENAPEGAMSRLDLNAGQNIRLHNFDGTTKFHISGIDVDSDLTVRLRVDTKARDLLTLAQIHQRNAETRISPARQWRIEHRGSGAMTQIVEATEHFGRIWTTVNCGAGSWTVFPVIAGQTGTVNRITRQGDRLQVRVRRRRVRYEGHAGLPGAEGRQPVRRRGPAAGHHRHAGGTGYTSAPTVSHLGRWRHRGEGDRDRLRWRCDVGRVHQPGPRLRLRAVRVVLRRRRVGRVGDGRHRRHRLGRWTSDTVAELIDDQRILLGAWGDEEQPGGYWPGQKTGDDGSATGDPLTGILLDDGGFAYRSFQPNPGVIYIAVYTKAACKIKPQRVLWPVLEAGM